MRERGTRMAASHSHHGCRLKSRAGKLEASLENSGGGATLEAGPWSLSGIEQRRSFGPGFFGFLRRLPLSVVCLISFCHTTGLCIQVTSSLFPKARLFSGPCCCGAACMKSKNTTRSYIRMSRDGRCADEASIVQPINQAHLCRPCQSGNTLCALGQVALYPQDKPSLSVLAVDANACLGPHFLICDMEC